MKTTVEENCTLETSFLLGCCCWLSWVGCLPVQFRRFARASLGQPTLQLLYPSTAWPFVGAAYALPPGMVIPSSIIWPLRPPVQKPAHLLDTSIQALLPYRCTHRLCTFRAAWRAWSWACLLPVSGKGSAPGEPRVRTLGEGFSLLGPEGSAGSPYMPGNGEDSLVLSIVGVGLGLRYAKALHARLGAWSPHQQPPGMLQRRLPAGPLSAFSTLSRRRIGVAFSALALFDKSGHLFGVPNPKRVQACPCSVQACNPSRRQNMAS
ncbi:uncharacterized protein LOC144162958 isoform X2 [Haemaphysalis longicornis]